MGTLEDRSTSASVRDQRLEMTHWSYEEEEGQRDAVPMVFISEDKL